MVDPKPLLKGFGAGADVFGQIATDKAVNARRRTPSTSTPYNSANGVLLEQVTLKGFGEPPSSPSRVKHDLGRTPKGAEVIFSSANNVRCSGVNASYVSIDGPIGTVVTLWVT